MCLNPSGRGRIAPCERKSAKRCPAARQLPPCHKTRGDTWCDQLLLQTSRGTGPRTEASNVASEQAPLLAGVKANALRVAYGQP